MSYLSLRADDPDVVNEWAPRWVLRSQDDLKGDGIELSDVLEGPDQFKEVGVLQDGGVSDGVRAEVDLAHVIAETRCRDKLTSLVSLSFVRCGLSWVEGNPGQGVEVTVETDRSRLIEDLDVSGIVEDRGHSNFHTVALVLEVEDCGDPLSEDATEVLRLRNEVDWVLL